MERPSSAVLVWGAGGHGRVVAEVARVAGMTVVGFVDSDPGKVGCRVEGSGTSVLLSEEGLLSALRRKGGLPFGADSVFPAVGDNRTRMGQVHRIGRHLAPPVVHPTAVVSPSATLHDGVFVGPLATINAGARVERGAIVNTAAIIGHDTVLGLGAHVSSQAVLAGGVHVGRGSLIGAGAVVLPCVRVGDEVVLGAGAVAPEDLADGARVAGVPARSLARKAAVEG